MGKDGVFFDISALSSPPCVNFILNKNKKNIEKVLHFRNKCGIIRLKYEDFSWRVGRKTHS